MIPASAAEKNLDARAQAWREHVLACSDSNCLEHAPLYEAALVAVRAFTEGELVRARELARRSDEAVLAHPEQYESWILDIIRKRAPCQDCMAGVVDLVVDPCAGGVVGFYCSAGDIVFCCEHHQAALLASNAPIVGSESEPMSVEYYALVYSEFDRERQSRLRVAWHEMHQTNVEAAR